MWRSEFKAEAQGGAGMHFQGDSAFDPLGHAFSVAILNNTRPMITKAKTRLIRKNLGWEL